MAQEVGVTSEDVTLVSDEEYSLVLENASEITVSGPVTVQSRESRGEDLVLVLRAESVTDRQSVNITTGEGDEYVFRVFPAPGTQSSSRAERYEELEETWVNQRLDTKQTSQGVLQVYEQRDPTRGPIDPETGLPQGEWQTIDIDENGNPQWLFDSPQGALVYTSQRANTRYGERTMWLAGSVAVVILSWIVQFFVIPMYNRRQEENFIYGN